MIKAIVFDYGNVISEPQDPLCYSRMAAISGLGEDIFKASFWKYRADFDRGTLRGVDMYRNVLLDAGIGGNEAFLSEMADKLLMEDILSWSAVSRAVTEWGLALRAQGFKLGILSNMPYDFLEIYGERIELFKEADAAVFSCHFKQIKPEPGIYHTLISEVGCKADEIVFFDDVQVNVEGARNEGIRAFLWTGIEQAKKDWEVALAST